ncbi:flagellar biosynthetic protein FliQ [uncultured Tateyamaria sp.]|uniref:EscS/YscS/HrcS family type III secretion system export apparatus protein n=1 Tax=uncultured Tateyamaria sp. TaxID=455651 RepID=UPI0026275EBB|nr:flagellar biosynthetic protein FliQ [uncultured Tateyamaria sp.]
MESSFSSLLVSFMVDVAILAGVPLLIATVSGFIVAFFQAVTQIQDQTLSQTIKISAVVIVLLIFGARLTGPLMISTVDIFENFHVLAR